MTSLPAVLTRLEQRPATLGAGQLLCIDGPAGSGKTTLGEAVVRSATADGRSVRVVHMDDLYPGWSGLPRIDEQLDALLLPLGEGRAGSYRRYDWSADQFAETVTVEPASLLVLEGVGSGASRFDSLRTLLVWVEAPREVRTARGLERDGGTFAPHWERWAEDEAELFARERTRTRADVVVDGTRPWA